MKTNAKNNAKVFKLKKIQLPLSSNRIRDVENRNKNMYVRHNTIISEITNEFCVVRRDSHF